MAITSNSVTGTKCFNPQNGTSILTTQIFIPVYLIFFFSQEPVSEEKKEDNEAIGRVDEGVEEFFTKKIIPDYAL